MKAHRAPSPDIDPVLLREARAGDERAFARLVRRYEGTVYSFAFKVCRDPVKATETVQDTFINVFLKLKQFDSRSKFTTWLYSIVVNNCLMKRRKTKLDESSISIDETAEGEGAETAGPLQDLDSPVQKVLSEELRKVLDDAIMKLSVDYRVVFVLRDVENLTAEEVARILKLSVPAVKSRLRRARIFLKNELEPYLRTQR
jgi:RNA polymerase sigma-70 factor (ECF subfamily)